ncbi:hypothetical protein GIB67_033429 [Kingdonia uniflora]|uniref:Uncharacterized protein n=1 Tax=Kingdonia uniflora TaxID=39325 RepID=A0A7J7LU79_9MAGN|nr:hypothetical protein GIB67_033429 [Kingdonia uniflora]
MFVSRWITIRKRKDSLSYTITPSLIKKIKALRKTDKTSSRQSFCSRNTSDLHISLVKSATFRFTIFPTHTDVLVKSAALTDLPIFPLEGNVNILKRL